MTRNEKIKKYRKKGMSLRELGQKFFLSPQRIQQIIQEKRKTCDIHKHISYGAYGQQCKVCLLENDFKEALEQSKNDRSEQIKRLSTPRRTRTLVIQRSILVKKLKDEGMSFSKIARLLKKDHTSIMYLYHKQI